MQLLTETTDRRIRQRDAASGELPRRQIEAMIIGTYREMPGLKLHLRQAARLFGLPVRTCQLVLDDLVRQGLVGVAAGGLYIRPEGNR